MEKKNKIIILALIVIIVVLLVVLASMMSHTSKNDTNLTFKSKSTLTEGDSLKIKLTDANGTALANQTVNITITEKNDTKSYYSVKTNENGTATLKLKEDPGKYNVTIKFGGNKKYNACYATKKITIKEEEKVTQTEEVQTGNPLDEYRTRSDTKMMVMPSGDVVEMSADESTVVSVNGDPHAFF